MADLGRRLEALERSGVVQRLAAGFKPTRQACIACGGDTPILEVYTGEARQRMCPRCRKEYAELAKIMCRTCGNFLGFMKSGVTEDGYYVKPDETLHTEYCSLCDPERAGREKAAPIEEFKRHAAVKRGNAMAGVIEAGAHRGELG